MMATVSATLQPSCTVAAESHCKAQQRIHCQSDLHPITDYKHTASADKCEKMYYQYTCL